MAECTDVIDREIRVDDFVFSNNYIYKVLQVNLKTVTCMIQPRSKTSKKKVIYGRDCCVIPKEEVLLWILKSGKNL